MTERELEIAEVAGAVSGWLSGRELAEISDLVEHGEPGVAYEMLCTQLYEHGFTITHDLLDRLTQIGRRMGLAPVALQRWSGELSESETESGRGHGDPGDTSNTRRERIMKQPRSRTNSASRRAQLIESLEAGSGLGALRELAQGWLDDGVRPEALHDDLEQVRALVTEEQEETALDVMDLLVGPCAPSARLRPRPGPG